MSYMPTRKPLFLSGKGRKASSAAVSAVIGDNSDLMLNAASLWISDSDIVADVTFGRGVFWRKLKSPEFRHDIEKDGVDCRKLPHANESIDVVVIDPPYRPSHGSTGFTGNAMQSAYKLGKTLDTINDVLSLYEGAIKEAHRVLRVSGRIMVKCQDISYANRLHLASIDILRQIIESGFEFSDQFVLLTKPNLKSPKWKNQERARRSHSIMWVATKKP